MKPLSDFIQTCLTLPSWLSALACILLAVGLIVSAHFLSIALSISGMVLKRLFPFLFLTSKRAMTRAVVGFVWRSVILAFLLFCFRWQISDGLQWVEQVYISPTYAISDTSDFALSCYQKELSKHVGPDTYRVIVEQTQIHAAENGTTPLAIYEVAFSECGLDPFRFNVNKKTGKIQAAGWIQFTNAGLQSLTIEGKPATMQQVIDACNRKDIRLIMDLTGQYFRVCGRGRKLPTALDVYVCVFGHAFLGMDENTVMYQGWNNDAYLLNRGFDGYRVERGRVVRLDRYCDGKITIGEVGLHLLAKKERFLKAYK